MKQTILSLFFLLGTFHINPVQLANAADITPSDAREISFPDNMDAWGSWM